MLRPLRLLPNALIYGIPYAILNYLIHAPEPLDEERVWKFITEPDTPGKRFVRECWPPRFLRPLILRAKMLQDIAIGIREHYDVSNDFYKLFLDPKFMFYSCADHVRGDETLVEAQTKKADFLLNLLDPKPGEKITELGCGWASMMRYIVERTGDKENISGSTLSLEQAKFVRETYGYDVRVENFVTADYPTEYYDKIISIGAWESVRKYEIPIVLEKLYRTLKPGGRFVLHYFVRLTRSLPASAAVSQLFFPGHIPAAYPDQVAAYEKAGFRITHTSVHDYRTTLRQWFENLIRHRDEAIKLVGVETYNRYVVFFPASYKHFDTRTGVLFRFVLSKPPIA